MTLDIRSVTVYISRSRFLRHLEPLNHHERRAYLADVVQAVKDELSSRLNDNYLFYVRVDAGETRILINNQRPTKNPSWQSVVTEINRAMATAFDQVAARHDGRL